MNGIAVDVSVIEKDAEIELNNNDAVQPIETAKQCDEAATEDNTANELPAQSDNGTENEAHIDSVEGELKGDDTPSANSDNADAPTDTPSANSNNADAPTAVNSIDTESSDKIDDQLYEANEQTGIEQPSETTVTENGASDEVNEQSGSGNEATDDSLSKKSPRKRLNKKRKTQKKSPDYSSLVNYTVSVSQRQRRFFVQVPHGRNIAIPCDECEIFCTNIPINVLEGELIPLFERYGKIWELRLMMSMQNPKRNAGFAFVRFTSPESATEATEKLNDYEILPGKHLSVRLSQPNLSLFCGNIHRGMTRDQIHEKISNRTTGELCISRFRVHSNVPLHSCAIAFTFLIGFCIFSVVLGLVKTFVKTSIYENTKNCGFCFLEYDCHSAAVKAKQLLNHGNVWGRQLFVDWAQRRNYPEGNEANESKTLFVNCLPKEITDQQLIDVFSPFGTIEKVTKIKDYAFVLFDEREAAVNAVNGADKANLGGDAIEIHMAMPKSTKNRPRYSNYSYRRALRRNSRSFLPHFKRYQPAPNNRFSRKPNRAKQDEVTGAISMDQAAMAVTPIETLAN